MTSLEKFDRLLRCVYTDPKSVAQVEWHRKYGLSGQLAEGRPLVLHEMPDFDWWEPRYDQPGRRKQARKREMGVA